jgi:hypothetical protein
MIAILGVWVGVGCSSGDDDSDGAAPVKAQCTLLR